MSQKNNMHSAEYIKTKVIDFFIELLGKEKIILGNEVMYGTTRKVVDLLLLTNDSLTAIEIKSENDNLLRLKEQLFEYHKNFNKIILCITEKHLTQIKKNIDKNVGILLYKEDSIQVIKNPIIRKKLDKKEILHSIPSVYLKQISEKKINALNSDEVRAYYSSKPLYQIQKEYYRYMASRLQENYNLFISERGSVSHIDDIPLLSLRSTIIDSTFIH
ncbi:MAG: sce7726 family protein [Bacteroidales bacterium]|nr:sce7726 family protein [Bacteroidales bacterium]